MSARSLRGSRNIVGPVGACSGAVMAVLCLAACVGPDFHRPAEPPVQRYLPPAEQAPSLPPDSGQRLMPGTEGPREWWREFHSPELDQMVEAAQRANPSLAAAQAALRQASEDARAQRAVFWPTIGFGATASRNRDALQVVQGARPMAVDNKTLGRFVLDGLPPAPRGMPQIEVTFDIDANGILKVTARDLQTGRSQHITLTASSGLSESELEQMRKDAEFYADHDRQALALVEARNYAENSLYNADGFLKAFGEKVPEQSQLEIVWAASELKNIINTDELDILKANTRALDQLLHRISSLLNESASSRGSAYYNPDIKTGPFNGINS